LSGLGSAHRVEMLSNTLSCCFGRAYRCDQDSYLVVKYLDGHVEHLNGPIQLFFDRWEHEDVAVKAHERFVASEQQCIDVVHRDGRFERKMGPDTITLDPFVHDKISIAPLKRHVASQGEYLVVQYKDGRLEHLRGPQEVAFHPLEHEKIQTHEALRLAANEAVVVYRRHEHSATSAGGPQLVAKVQELPPATKTGASLTKPGGAKPAVLTTEAAGEEGARHVERRVVHGPAVFIPDSNEWLHTFSWHGSVKADGKGSKTGYAGDVKVPHALNFQVIRCMPDSIYLSVRDVRTIDDANLTVHLMLFYELKDIETMLDSTNDMTGDIINAASADVMTFTSRLTYETFLQETAELSRVENFPILSSRMSQTGNALLKVVYRGYGASAQLQEMHDQAISRRTKLRLEADAAREEQEKRSMELRCRKDRSTQEQELEATTAKHKLELLALNSAQEAKKHDEEHAQNLRYQQETYQVELANQRAVHEQELQRQTELTNMRAAELAKAAEVELQKYSSLKDMGVDLTSYLVALAASNQQPDTHIKLEHSGGDHPPALHLELPASSLKKAR